MTARPDALARAHSGFSALELQPFDFSREILSDILELDLPSDPQEGRVVAVRATSRAREKDWAAHAAIAISGHWASRGARVLLVDLGFEQPHLHRAFSVWNLEGIADAIEYGASLRRIARPVNDGAFWLATAGTPVADSRALLDQPSWGRLLKTLIEGGVTVVTYQLADSTVHPRGVPSIVLACKGEPMSALGKVGLRDAIALLGPAPSGISVAIVTRRRENRLGAQSYQPSLWDGFEDDVEAGKEASQEDFPDSATAGERTASAPAPVGSGSRAKGRGLSVSAFAVLILFATLMILMGIDNAGIAEVPGASRLWALFERLLARISQFFV